MQGIYDVVVNLDIQNLVDFYLQPNNPSYSIQLIDRVLTPGTEMVDPCWAHYVRYCVGI